MTISDIRKLSDEEVLKKITDTKKLLFDLRMKQASGTLEHPYEIHTLRKEVARMKTILSERKIEASKNVKKEAEKPVKEAQAKKDTTKKAPKKEVKTTTKKATTKKTTKKITSTKKKEESK